VSHPDLDVSALLVWLPMYPRFAEGRALPNAVEEYANTAFTQCWDDTGELGKEFKRKIIPDFGQEVAWDVYVLFDEEARWATAEKHLVSWGFPVIDTAERLFAELERFQQGRARAPKG